MKRMLLAVACLVIFGVLVFFSDYFFAYSSAAPKVGDGPYRGRRVLHIDSYHAGYEWSDGIVGGVRDGLVGSGIELRVVRMDTKRHTDEAFMQQAVDGVLTAIREFKPDAVIAADDNAFKHVIMPHFRDAALPVVFVGLNWDASVYDAPYTNTAGMVEITLMKQLIKHLRVYAKGDRVGYLTADVYTQRKNIAAYKKILDLEFDQVAFAKSLNDWKSKYITMQSQVDMIVFENSAGITEWDLVKAANFARARAEVPLGTTSRWVMPVALIGMTKDPGEFGRWAAGVIKRLFDGETPDAIGVTRNKHGDLLVNLAMAETLNVAIAADVLRHAEVVDQQE